MSYTIPTNGKPTPVSRSMWVGAAIGGLISGLSIITVPVGIIAGYVTGKSKQQEELNSGQKAVKNPTVWNSGLAKGLIIGSVIAVVAAVAITAGAIALSGGWPALVAAATANAVPTATTLSGIAGAKAGGLLGLFTGAAIEIGSMIKGAKNRKHEMQREYAEAKAYHEQSQAMGYGLTREPVKSLGKQRSNSITPSMTQGFAPADISAAQDTNSIQRPASTKEELIPGNAKTATHAAR